MSQKIKTSVEIDGSLTASQIANATTDTDKFLVSDGGTVKYRTGAELASDLGIASGSTSKVQHQVKAGVAINKGQAVYVTSADGTNMIVGLASNASEATSSKTMGLLNATVAVNDFADVVTEGLLDGLDTSTATVGNPVWLGTGGNLIYGLVNKPYAPNHLVFIGIVTRVNANNGEIFVKVQNGFELDEIHDVDLKTTTKVNGHLLGYNGSLWVNKTIAEWLGYTPYNASNPAGYISSYTETDTLSSVTGRGASTSNQITLSGGGDNSNTYSSLRFSGYNQGGGVGYHGFFEIENTYSSGTNKKKFFRLDSSGTIQIINSAYTANIFNLTDAGDLTVNKIIKSGGTSSQYLMADGSVSTGGGGGVTSFNTRTGAVTLSSGDVTSALGYTPYNSSNPNGYISSYTETDTLASVTGRGATTSTSITAKSGSTSASLNAFAFMGAGEFMTTGSNAGYFFERREGSVTSTTNWAGWYYSGSSIRLYNGSSDIFSIAASNGAATFVSNVSGRNSFYVKKSNGDSGGELSFDSSINQLYLWNSVSTGYFSIYTNNAERLNISSGGAVTANVDMRSPIFYDSNNTGYYGDFANTSRINTIHIDTLRGPQGDWLLGYQSTSTYSLGSTAVVDTLNIDFSNVKFSPGSGNLGNNYFWLNKGGSNDGGLLWSRDNALDWQMINATGSGDLTFYAYGSGTNVLTLGRSGGAVTATGSMRAPIFYDSNDTTYYGDFNSTTRQYQAISFGDSTRYSAINTTINGAGAGDKLILYGGTSNYDARLLVGADYDMLFKSQGNSAGKGSFKFYSGLNSALALTIDGYQNTSINGSLSVSGGSSWFGGYGGGSGPGLAFENQNTFARIVFWGLDFYDWNHGTQMVIDNGYVLANNSMRSPIFYDSNDTTYYGDFASTSYLRHLSVGDVNAANDGGWNARLNLTGSSHARLDVKSNSDGIITTMYSHTGQGVGRVGTYSNHPLAFMVNAGIAGYAYANYIQGVDSVRAPIFYDSDNTGYYLNPASISYLSTLRISDASSGASLIVGTNDTSRVYSDDPRKQLAVNADYYPCVYVNALSNNGNTTHGAVISMSGNLNSGGYRRWGMGIANTDPGVFSIGYADNNSNPHYGVGGSGWSQFWIDTSGNTFSTGSTRSPIFYDNNNTAYYVDPASTSNLNALNVGGSGVLTYGNAPRAANSYVMFYEGFTLNANDMSTNSTGFTYSNNAPWTGPIARFSTGGGYDLWLNASYGGDGTALSYRTRNGDAGTNNSWHRIYSDSYKPNADKVNGYGGYDHVGSGLRPFYNWGGSNGGASAPNGSTYTNGISVGSHPSDPAYGFQIANNMWNTGLWTRSYNSYSFDGWVRLLDSSNYSQYCNFGGNTVYGGIFYDGNNTGYYVDPSNTSNINTAIVNGLLSVAGSTGNYNEGIRLMSGTGSWSNIQFGANTSGVGTQANQWIVGKRPEGTFVMSLAGNQDSGSRFLIDQGGGLQSPIYYDGNNTGYYCDPSGTSNLNDTVHKIIRFAGVGGDSGNGSNPDSYAIYQQGGSWSYPYPDLCIGYHTGIKIGAYYGYNGTRFYNNSDWATITASVNDGDNNFRGYYDVIAYASDRRLKHKVKPIDNALSKVKSLTGMTYQWNEIGKEHGWDPDTEVREAGVFAQDVQAVLPEAVRLAPFDDDHGVSRSGESFLTVKYDKIVPLLIEAIKEQQTQIEELKELVNKLINK